MSLILPNKTMFMRADCTPPSAWMGHIPFAGWLVEAIEPAMIVELGTHHGTSYLAFCQAVEANGLPTRCFAVDTWEGDEHAGMYGENVYAELAGYHARKYAGFSRLMRMTFDEAASYFEDGSVDLLHIDGLHTQEAVRHDFETWLPKLSSRGVIIFHDTCVREREFGVWRFWAEVSSKYPSFEFTHSHGLGILAVGEKIPSQLQALLAGPGGDEGWLVNQMFESLGSVIEANSEIERLMRALAHEQACRRQDAVDAMTRVGDAIREQVECVRRDVAHVGNLLVSGSADAETKGDQVWRDSVESIQGELRVGFDFVRHDIAFLRDTLVAAEKSAAEEWRLRSSELLGAQVRADEELRAEVLVRTSALHADVAACSALLQTEVSASTEFVQSKMLESADALQAQLSELTQVLRSDMVTTRDQLLRSESRQTDSLLDAVARVQRGIFDLSSRGFAVSLRRLLGRGGSSLDQ